MPQTAEGCINLGLGRALCCEVPPWQPKILTSWPRRSRLASGTTWAASLEAFPCCSGEALSICSSGTPALSCHIVKADIFSSKRKGSQGGRLTALIGGYPFVCSGSVPDNRSALRRRGGECRERKWWEWWTWAETKACVTVFSACWLR